MNNREYRMYGLVPYNISPIQQGIQFGHAAVEYGIEFSDTPEYQTWARRDKTFIILNGGTTNKNSFNLGTLNNHYFELTDRGIPVGEFHEPDLGDQLTAVVFLVDDRVWNKETYPDVVPTRFHAGNGPEDLVRYREFEFNEWKKQFGDDADTIVFLRDFLKNFRLA
jgi:hypothetical protein